MLQTRSTEQASILREPSDFSFRSANQTREEEKQTTFEISLSVQQKEDDGQN